MDTLLLQNCEKTETVIREAHRMGMPLAVENEDGTCLIAMTPAVFEHILFDTAILNLGNRDSIRF